MVKNSFILEITWHCTSLATRVLNNWLCRIFVWVHLLKYSRNQCMQMPNIWRRHLEQTCCEERIHKERIEKDTKGNSSPTHVISTRPWKSWRKNVVLSPSFSSPLFVMGMGFSNGCALTSVRWFSSEYWQCLLLYGDVKWASENDSVNWKHEISSLIF